MKKLLHLLLLLSVTLSFSVTKIETNFSDQTVFSNPKQDYVTQSTKFNKVATTLDPISLNIVEVDFSQLSNNLKDLLNYNFNRFVSHFSIACNLKIYYQNSISIHFKKTDIAYPFHAHL